MVFHVTGDWPVGLERFTLRCHHTVAGKAGVDPTGFGIYFARRPLWHYAGGERRAPEYYWETNRTICALAIDESQVEGVWQSNCEEEEEFVVRHDLDLVVERVEEGRLTHPHPVSWMDLVCDHPTLTLYCRVVRG